MSDFKSLIDEIARLAVPREHTNASPPTATESETPRLAQRRAKFPLYEYVLAETLRRSQNGDRSDSLDYRFSDHAETLAAVREDHGVLIRIYRRQALDRAVAQRASYEAQNAATGNSGFLPNPLRNRLEYLSAEFADEQL